MIGGGEALAFVEGVGFDEGAVGDALLQGFDHVAGRDVGTVRLAGSESGEDGAGITLKEF